MKKKRRKRRFRAFLLLLMAVLLILADSRWRLSSEEYHISSDRLPESFEGFRIVQLSDLHGMSFGEGNSRLVEKVESLQPDLIALTGDYIEGEEQLEGVRTLCIQLTEIAPVYFVSGNHDAGSGKLRELKELLEDAGVNYLANEYEDFSANGAKILICGVEDPNAWSDMRTPNELVSRMRENDPADYALLLGHRNDWPEKYPALDVDLILSGHGHGGILRLPFLGGILGTNVDLFPEYDAGAFESGSYTMVVSRGLGGYAYIPRFLNPPDIPVIVLHNK